MRKHLTSPRKRLVKAFTSSRQPYTATTVCVEWRGDSPVEYWSEDDPEEPELFNLAEVNRQLAALGGSED